jgi:hypothetical protein
MALGPGCAVRHDNTIGAARPATVAVRKNWRRDHGGAAEWGVSGVGEGKEAALSFMPTG